MGCANPEGATGGNIARQIALRAGLSVTTAGITVNRFCSSGLQSIAMASQRIMAGEGTIYSAGGGGCLSPGPKEKKKNTGPGELAHEKKPRASLPMALNPGTGAQP